MIMFPMGGGMGGAAPYVAPSEIARRKAVVMKILLVLHFIITIFMFMISPFSAIFELLAVGIGYWGIKNPGALRPSLIQGYAFFCGISSVFELIYFIILCTQLGDSASNQQYVFNIKVAVAFRAIAFAFYAFACRWAWLLYKECLLCAPASSLDSVYNSQQYGNSSSYNYPMHHPSGGGSQPAAGPSYVSSGYVQPSTSGNGQFQAFAGTGFRLGGPQGSVAPSAPAASRR
eukprot:GILK01002053.1.p1 GENE.GILK01002053.1~~GILK01002053.1.p1  ORF type:complete len:231 (+),score=16.55 GILK01002053.1:115-807(+)